MPRTQSQARTALHLMLLELDRTMYRPDCTTEDLGKIVQSSLAVARHGARLDGKVLAEEINACFVGTGAQLSPTRGPDEPLFVVVDVDDVLYRLRDWHSIHRCDAFEPTVEQVEAILDASPSVEGFTQQALEEFCAKRG